MNRFKMDKMIKNVSKRKKTDPASKIKTKSILMTPQPQPVHSRKKSFL